MGIEALRDQFRHPRGLVGGLVGHLMALKNKKRSLWALGLLAPRPGERVLEIGFGSGADVRRLLEAVGPRGHVAGVDVSQTMLDQARTRNRQAAASGRAELRLGGVERLPYGDAELDAAFSVNCAQFWSELGAGFLELHRVVRRGGRVVIAVQPMRGGATVADSRRWAEDLVAAATAAGWLDATAHLGPTMPPAAAVTARK